MAAPGATVRSAPLGKKLEQGFSTKVTFGDDPDISVWERSVTPPAIDGGDPVDSTTMHNVKWTTMFPNALATLEPFSFGGIYDPDLYDEFLAIINVNDEITVTFPDLSTLAIWGYARRLEFAELVRGSAAECTATIQPTNTDAAQAEYGFKMTEIAGT